MPFKNGRGATNNQASTRFNLAQREADGDWLDEFEEIDGPASKLRTTVTELKSKTIITRNSSPDIGFSQSINAFAGCEHGCIYCFARPTHARMDLSPGLDFESRLFVKPEAARLLRAELARPRYVVRTIAMGTNTDPYQPIEGRYRITRACIEVLAACRHPLMITTKSDRVTRDLDLLAPMAAQELVAVALSVTSLDPALSRKLEPRAPHPRKRLAAIRALSEAGVPVNACISPIIPAINDMEIEALVEATVEAGARSVSNIPVRLPFEVAPLFREWLAEHFPDRADKVMHQIQSIRGGRDNDPDFGTRMRGQGPYADLIRLRFDKARARHGIHNDGRISLRKDLFVPPSDQGRLF
ncbi:PA0069 family radical SAM protein [Sphingobium nicotianae]|uniref:PA0069 family radical SAM protein n=1 Tax=Sphingobium nicotianae TaxID=2782607 RepID=A0A9X1AIB1_9SPHN|nr:PA0069 family radical SAM protein [Sphingobium nicotianae]MBT2185752.1 PA0069 family radical SAM protein [Sphingobium nicotianae]